ncbi:Nuclear transcription factor Y subunit A-3 [Raphanus sativus]|nr:Nuclear transcription factor Y subunit A-3 [Raphanus sativus]
MRRREQRAKLEAQNKLIKGRKAKRIRWKIPQHPKNFSKNPNRLLLKNKNMTSRSNRQNMSRFKAYMLQHNKDRGLTTSGSDITSVSDGAADIFGHTEFQRFSNNSD